MKVYELKWRKITDRWSIEVGRFIKTIEWKPQAAGDLLLDVLYTCLFSSIVVVKIIDEEE